MRTEIHWTVSVLIHCRTATLPQCPDHRSPPQWSAGRLSARWPPQTAPRHQTPAAGPTWGKASRSGPASVHVGWVNRLTDVNEHEVRRVNRTPTSVTWLCEEKKTRAKGSERPLLSAANRLRAWYMCALSWNTCFTAGHVLKYQNVDYKSNLWFLGLQKSSWILLYKLHANTRNRSCSLVTKNSYEPSAKFTQTSQEVKFQARHDFRRPCEMWW